MNTKQLMLMIIGLVFSVASVLMFVLITNRVTAQVNEVITTVSNELITNEMEVLLQGNSTVTSLTEMQGTLRDLHNRMSDIFK
ncbi:MAG TPA: hypothetical protein VI790_00630 [Candidatus Nanoarchaeia archaeon]|nr:hypothetical protein [Candidatus Nanoarchaeia archaeon]